MTSDRPPTCRPTRQPDGSVRWRVWAPRTNTVDLVLFSGTTTIARRMRPADHGCFTHVEPSAPAETRYGYLLDGGPLCPDPCSLSQPAGVHQPSALFFPQEY